MRLIANRNQRLRHARQTARARDAEDLVATEFPGSRPTLVGVARDVTDRVFVRSEGERVYEPYHRRDHGTTAVVRVEEEGDQDLPAYCGSFLQAERKGADDVSNSSEYLACGA